MLFLKNEYFQTAEWAWVFSHRIWTSCCQQVTRAYQIGVNFSKLLSIKLSMVVWNDCHVRFPQQHPSFRPAANMLQGESHPLVAAQSFQITSICKRAADCCTLILNYIRNRPWYSSNSSARRWNCPYFVGEGAPKRPFFFFSFFFFFLVSKMTTLVEASSQNLLVN